jgi:hypothetical protein
MNKFGTLKSKLLQQITKAYTDGNKKEIRNILKTITENRDVKGLYLFYEHVENAYIEDKEDAKIFINSIIPLLQEKTKLINIKKISKQLNETLKDVAPLENSVYDDLDMLSEQDTLLNLNKKIIAKLRLIEHLTTKKEIDDSKENPLIENEALLHTVLTSNFNALYGATLTEEEQDELKKILSVTNDELQKNFMTLKEEVNKKMGKMLTEEKNIDLRAKLEKALDEVKTMKPTKYQYYKLQQLKSGL